MRSRVVIPLFFALLAVCIISAKYPSGDVAAAAPQSDRPQLPPTYIPSGRQMFQEYCASCHGPDGKGLGPVAPLFRKPPTNLTTLAKNNAGVFPREHVAKVIRFGPGVIAHGSMEMPVWGPVFKIVENYNEAAVTMRIKNLCDFIESIQEK
jgi:mono/diheme cytochrome c family protein